MSFSFTGARALVKGALDSGISLAAGVPGYPVTALMDLLMESKLEARWSINEKVALEAALGASAVGRRAVVIVKHVGMNLLSDPLITSTTHTIGAGVVIIAGDDPGARQSQNEQDSRYYGLLAEIPVFDPPNPNAGYLSMIRGLKMSEEISAPVIIRVTKNFLSMNGDVPSSPPAAPVFPKFDRRIWSCTLKGKHERFHSVSYPRMKEIVETSDLNVLHKRDNNIGIISSGHLSEVIETLISEKYPDISHLALALINPLPNEIIDRFIHDHKKVMVVEETEPVLEQQMSCLNVLGKLTGHLNYGKLEADDIIWALEHIDHDRTSRPCEPQTLSSRGYSKSICEDCPYHVLYRALAKIKGPVAGDLGCSVRTAPPPMEVVDVAYSLGSSIAVATGFDEKGIALIGDFGLVHTGLQGLIEALIHKKDVLVIVLQNNMAALTGGQFVPDMTALIKSLVPGTIILDMENVKEKELAGTLESELKKEGISMFLARGKCRKY